VLGFVLKVGLPPMHIWFIKLSFFMEKWVFLVFSTLHKLLPLFLLGRLLLLGSYLSGILLLVAGRLIFQVFELFFILITSSIVHRRWTLLRIQYRLKLSLTYWVLYSLVFFTFLSTLHFSILFKRGVEQSSSTSVMWLVLSGLPPFIMFWLKVWIFLLIVQVRVSLRLALILISVLALTSYFRAFHVSLRLTFFSGTLRILVMGIFFLSFI
jgi:NADH:ubiquinone oxidoreductase subunit 2 (subunit N)